MPDYREVAKKYIKKGFWVIPVNSLKRPSIPKTIDYQTKVLTEDEVEKYFKKCHGIAFMCGGPTNLELLDFDMKYDTTGTLYERICKEVPPAIKSKMLVQTTKNKGFHWWYKIDKKLSHPNQKLANRRTTPIERDLYYSELFKNPKERDNAMKKALNDSHRVLVETRGGTEDKCGGYGLIAPSPNYKIFYSPKEGINTLSSEEHEELFSILRSFNEVAELDNFNQKNYDNTEWEITPFEDFNERGDTLEILFELGWEQIGSSGKSIRLKRPGCTSGSSALYDTDTTILNCFSTSTRLDPNKGYNPSGIFIEFEADGNPSVAYSKLINLGFGVKK